MLHCRNCYNITYLPVFSNKSYYCENLSDLFRKKKLKFNSVQLCYITGRCLKCQQVTCVVCCIILSFLQQCDLSLVAG